MKFSAWEVWWVDLPPGRDHEQKGRRPAVIVAKANGLGVVVPLTGELRALRFNYTCSIQPSKENCLREEGTALVFQLTTLDELCFIEKIGWLPEKEREPLKALLKDLFKLA